MEFDLKESPTEEMLKKRKNFENLYQKQELARENLKINKIEKEEKTKDPKEMMLNIQSNFIQMYTSKINFCFIL